MVNFNDTDCNFTVKMMKSLRRTNMARITEGFEDTAEKKKRRDENAEYDRDVKAQITHVLSKLKWTGVVLSVLLFFLQEWAKQIKITQHQKSRVVEVSLILQYEQSSRSKPNFTI